MNKKEFIPYGRHSIDERDINNVIDVLRNNNLTQGPKIKEFENAISEYCDCSFSIAVNSATSALHLACLALDLKQGDWLWTTPITFVASANCAIYCNAKIDFVDINISTGLIDIDSLRKKLLKAKKENKLPKIIIPVHLSGSSCDMLSIHELSKEFGFYIIEDASHAIGGKYREIPVGSCKYSQITVFSFHPVKIITTGEGGLLTTNDSVLSQKIYDLRSHGIIKDSNRFLNTQKGAWYYEQQSLGFNFRITDIQAALGLSQLQKIDSFVRERNKILEFYKGSFKDMPIEFLEIPKDVYSSVHLAVIRLKNELILYHRKIFEELQEEGIGVQLHYLPVHLHPFYQKMGFKIGMFPNSEKYANSSFSIPIYPTLSNENKQRIVKTLKKIINTYV